MLKNEKGITLIALIITIIVMLILVGVTINVALNGGLLQKAETATYQTEASLVKEQLEIAKAIELANAEGKEIEDYSYIKVESLDGLDPKTKNKFKDIILVSSNGDVCYNPANVTDEEKTMLEAIGIKVYASNEEEKFTFTIGEIAPYATSFEDGYIVLPEYNFWTETVSEEIINSGIELEGSGGYMLYENATCFNSIITNQTTNVMIDRSQMSFPGFLLFKDNEDNIWLGVFFDSEGTTIGADNWETYKDLSFTITL